MVEIATPLIFHLNATHINRDTDEVLRVSSASGIVRLQRSVV